MIRFIALSCLCLLWPSANLQPPPMVANGPVWPPPPIGNQLLMGKGLGFFDTKAEAYNVLGPMHKHPPEVEEVKVNN